MRPSRRGITLLELMVALFVLFLTVSFMAYVFAASGTHIERDQQRTNATMLAQTKMQQELAGVPSVTVGSGGFLNKYSAYLYEVSDAPYPPAPLLHMLTVTVTAPDGFKTALEDLYGSIVTLGLVSEYDPSGPTTTYNAFAWLGGPPAMFLYNDLVPGSSPLPPLPTGATSNALAGTPDFSALWAVDATAGLVWKGLNATTPGMAWTPVVLPAALTRPNGIVHDANKGALWLLDRGAGALWRQDDATSTWTGPFTPAAPFGDAIALAINHDGTQVYVLDTAASTLTYFTPATGLWSAPIPTPAGFVTAHNMVTAEPEDPIGTSNEIVVMDSKALWSFDMSAQSWSFVAAMPPAVVTGGPEGICFHDNSAADDWIYVESADGQIWFTGWDSRGGWTKVF